MELIATALISPAPLQVTAILAPEPLNVTVQLQAPSGNAGTPFDGIIDNGPPYTQSFIDI